MHDSAPKHRPAKGWPDDRRHRGSRLRTTDRSRCRSASSSGISLYWLGLSSIFAGVTIILTGRIEFDALVPPEEAGRTLFLLTIGGAVIAAIVQPTVGSISDYTISRWGRRKPYIFIGSVLDVVFLLGIALSQELVAIAAFVALLQFSSNFAQGPFQGYVPDLVPAPQVGMASALVGLMQILGNVSGFVIGGIAVATGQFALGFLALGILELVTMLSVVIRVREGKTPKSRGGRSWFSIAAEAWGTDVLRERSFVFLVASRLAILMAGGVLTNLALFYLVRSLAMEQEAAGGSVPIIAGAAALGTLVTIVPAARLSDRIGRKRVIWGSCVIGAVGLTVVALAGSFPAALIGSVLYGLVRGHLPGRRLGAHDRHHPEGVVRPVHGPVQRGDRLGRRAGGRDRWDADGPRRRRRRTTRRPVDGRRPLRGGGAPARTGRRTSTRGPPAAAGSGRRHASRRELSGRRGAAGRLRRLLRGSQDPRCGAPRVLGLRVDLGHQ